MLGNSALNRFTRILSIAGIGNIILFYILVLLNLNYLVSAVIGYLFAALIIILVYSFMGFDRGRKRLMTLVKFFIFYTATFFGGIVFLFLLTFLGVTYLLSNPVLIILTIICNWLLSKYIVFKRSKLSLMIDFWIYRYRYLATYILIGLFSIFVEVLIIRFVKPFFIPYIATFIGFVVAMVFAYILNSTLNFKVPKEKRLRTFYVFAIISVFAYALNIILIQFIFSFVSLLENYSLTRFISAACVFLISYYLHRKYTFTDVKDIGIAVYLSDTENINDIYRKVSHYPDWIHLDLVDRTFNESAKRVAVHKGFEVRNYWPNHKTMTHIMSKYPSRWIHKVAPFSDTIIIHVEIDEPVEEVLASIKKIGKKSGITILSTSQTKTIFPYLNKVDVVQMLGIGQPGQSGQHMNAASIDQLNIIRKIKKKRNLKFELAFDGGIKLSNIGKINAKYIVSGSTVLRSEDVIKSIHTLKTSSRYYYEQAMALKKFIRKKVFEILDEFPFVISGSFVGTFVDKKGIEGISDIDTIVIVDKLTKEKFDKIMDKFWALAPVLKTDFEHDLIVNNTFGPLKFNQKRTVVIHLMIYDRESHIEHCVKSPFTCLDWQRTNTFIKSHMKSIFDVTFLQPNYFFNARRSVTDYIQDLKNGKISYREYDFTGKVTEVKKNKPMDPKHKFEFSYHIIKFCMVNFLKLYTGENKHYTVESAINKYFDVFPENRYSYTRYLMKVKNMKATNAFTHWKREHGALVFSFLKDFEKQFNHYFNYNATKIYFTRHLKTNKNKPNVFIGRNTTAKVLKPKQSYIEEINTFFKPKNIVQIYSSPADRCLATLEHFGDALEQNRILLDTNLHEIDYGAVDGKDLKHLSKKYPNIVKAWKAGKDPRFPEGENTADIRERMLSFLASLDGDINAQMDGDRLVCTHNVFLRTLIGHLCKLPMERWYLIEIPHDEIFEVIRARDGKWYPNLTDEQRRKVFKNMINL